MKIFRITFYFGMLCIWLCSVIGINNGKQEIVQKSCNTPVDELVQELEYVYKYMNIPGKGHEDYGELGELPQGVSEISIYMLEGNKLLFLPVGKGNTEIKIEQSMHEVYYSSMEDGYIFFAMEDWALEENGVPVNYFGNRRLTYLLVGKNEGKEYCLNDLEWIGKADVNFSNGITPNFPDVRNMENEYINILLDEISDVLGKKQKYGIYDIYIMGIQRVREKYGGTSCLVDFVINGNGICEYACFVVYDTGDIGGVFSLGGPHFQDTGYFTDLPEEKCRDMFSTVISGGCEPIQLDVSKETEPRSNGFTDVNAAYVSPVDFRNMSPTVLARQIGDLCSYCEWYGMKELGYQEGKIGEFNGRNVVMYTWKSEGGILFFIPLDATNTVLKGENNMEYPVYVNEKGNMVFYKTEINPYARMDWCKTTFIMKEEIPVHFVDRLLKLGEEKIEIRSFLDLEVPKAGMDEYIQALQEYVEKQLRENGKKGKYIIYLGEYETVWTNKVCISAAVVGEKEYYVRYLVVKYGEGNFHFWPMGFGLDGSLAECEAERHYMNGVCIERTKKLERFVLEIDVL